MKENNPPVQRTRAERELALLPIAGLFRKFAIPGVVGLLFLGLQTIIDGVVLGNFVGANALASVNLIMPAYSLISAVAIIMGVGTQTLVSIRLGSGDAAGANDAMTSGFRSLMGFSVIVAVLVYVFAYPVVRLLGANSVLEGDAVVYLRTLMLSFPMVGAMFFGDYMLKALGRPVYSMAVMSATVVVNIVLDLVFVIPLGMGVAGAALATGLAFTLGACGSLPFLLRRTSRVNLLRGRMRWRLVWRMLYNGSSEGATEFSSGVSTWVFNLTVMHYLGENGVAAFAAINYTFFIGITILLGVSDGVIPVVGFNYGAGRWDRIVSMLKLASRANLAIGIGLFLLLTLFGGQVIAIFFRVDDAAAMQIARHGAAVYAFAFLLNGQNILASSYFTAIANAKVSIVISLLRGMVLVVFGILVYPLLLGIDGIWLAVPLAECMTFAVSIWLVTRSLKQRRAPVSALHGKDK